MGMREVTGQNRMQALICLDVQVGIKFSKDFEDLRVSVSLSSGVGILLLLG